MISIPAVILVFKILTLFLGGSIAFFAFKAYKRTKSSSLWALSIGFGVVTIGAILAGAVDQIFNLERSIALVIESAFTASGFAIILYSLYN